MRAAPPIEGAPFAAEVVVRARRFASDDSGFAVLDCDSDGERVVLVGPLVHLEERERVAVTGSWTIDRRYGPQVKVREAHPVAPSDAEALLAYLRKVRHVGPVLARERCELLPRAAARARLGVSDDRLVVYVSAGGGGDAGAERHLHEVVAALAGDPGLHLVVGAGPLYRGLPLPGVTWHGGQLAFPLMAGFDLEGSEAERSCFQHDINPTHCASLRRFAAGQKLAHAVYRLQVLRLPDVALAVGCMLHELTRARHVARRKAHRTE